MISSAKINLATRADYPWNIRSDSFGISGFDEDGKHLFPLPARITGHNNVFSGLDGSPGLLREVYLPVSAILRLQITPPLALIADVAQTRQHNGHDAIVAAAQQADNGGPPDCLHRFLFKEEASPYAVLNVETAPRDGDVDTLLLCSNCRAGSSTGAGSVQSQLTGSRSCRIFAFCLFFAVPP